MNLKISAFALACLFGLSLAETDPRLEQGARFEAQGSYEMALGEYRAMIAENKENSAAYFAAAQLRMKMKDFNGALANYRLAYKYTPSMSAAYEGAAKVYEALGQKDKADAERAKDPKNQATPAEQPAPKAAEAAPAAQPAAPVAEAKPAPAAQPKTAEPAAVAQAPVAQPATQPATPAPAPKATETAPATQAAAPAAQPAAPAAQPVAPAAKPAAAPVAETKPAAAPVEDDPFERGKALLAEGKYSDAANAWRDVLKKKPNYDGAYFYAGITRLEMGELDRAEINLKKGLTYKEEGVDANYYLSVVYQKKNKPDLEQKFLTAYLNSAAPNGKFRAKAEERLTAMKAAKAESDKAAAEAKAKSDSIAAASGAVAPAAPAAAAPAPVASAPVQDENVNTDETSIASANLLFRSGSHEAALQMYKALLETEQTQEERYFTMLQLGNVYRELRDFHSAVTRYREIVQQFPDSDWAAEAERALEDAVWLEKHAKDLPLKKR